MVKIDDKIPNGEPCIKAFTFQTSFYALNSWDKRQAELFHWRDILKQFPEFDVFLAGIFSPFLIDQRHTIAPSSMQTIGTAIIVMGIMCVFFLPNKVFYYLKCKRHSIFSAMYLRDVLLHHHDIHWSLWRTDTFRK